MKSCLIFFAIVTTVANTHATDYCTMNCLINGNEMKHIGCDNDGTFGTSCPDDVEMIDFDDSLQKYILDEHNIRRNLVAGGDRPACRMATMRWENELTAHAAMKSNQCSDIPEYCHPTTAFPNSTHYSKQFYYSDFAVEDMVKTIVTTFLDSTEIQLYHNIDLYNDRNNRVGCAASYANSKYTRENGKPALIVWFTCNYSTGADKPYDTCTKSGENCETGLNDANYPHLCSIGEQY